MFIRHKKASTYCIYYILKRDINIFMFEDDELIKLTQLIANLFEDHDVALAQVGEEILFYFVDKFKNENKIQMFFYWLQIHVKTKSADRIRKHIQLNYPEIYDLINQGNIVQVSINQPLKKVERPINEIDKIFKNNCQNVMRPLTGIENQISGKIDNCKKSQIDVFDAKFSTVGGGNFGESGSIKGIRNHRMQNQLLGELESLINS